MVAYFLRRILSLPSCKHHNELPSSMIIKYQRRINRSCYQYIIIASPHLFVSTWLICILVWVFASLGRESLKRVIYMENGNSASRLQRNMKERVRRKHMKDLLSELAFLVPLQSSKVSATELLDHATTHIKHLQEKVEERRRRRALLLKDTRGEENKKSGSILPVLNIKCSDSDLEINLICGSDKSFTLQEIISILHQEGAEVISATQYYAGTRLIYNIKSQAISSRIGVETTRVRQRIKDLCF